MPSRIKGHNRKIIGGAPPPPPLPPPLPSTLLTDASTAHSAQSAYTFGGCTGGLHSPVKKEHTCSISINFI